MVMLKSTFFAALAGTFLAASALGASTSGSSNCYHKIIMDFTACPSQSLATYQPIFRDLSDHTNWIFQAKDLKELCIPTTNTKGNFFQSVSPSNEFGINVYGVTIDFGSQSTSATFFENDDFGTPIDRSPASYSSFQLIDGSNPQRGSETITWNKNKKVTWSGANVNVKIVMCKKL